MGGFLTSDRSRVRPDLGDLERRTPTGAAEGGRVPGMTRSSGVLTFWVVLRRSACSSPARFSGCCQSDGSGDDEVDACDGQDGPGDEFAVVVDPAEPGVRSGETGSGPVGIAKVGGQVENGDRHVDESGQQDEQDGGG